MRIPTLLQKLSELSSQPDHRTAIDVDLMLDYTRVLYADLLEWRARLPAATTTRTVPRPITINEPTLDEQTKSREQEKATDNDPAPVVNHAKPEPVNKPEQIA